MNVNGIICSKEKARKVNVLAIIQRIEFIKKDFLKTSDTIVNELSMYMSSFYGNIL